MKNLLCLLIFLPSLCWGQNMDRNMEKEGQIKETLRFIRLAETRKNLTFSDEKLLRVNEILDQIEDRKIDLVKQERKVRFQISKPGLNETSASSLIMEYRRIKKEHAELDLLLFDKIIETLSPLETIEFFVFYEEFRRKMSKQIQMLRQRNRPNKPFPKRRG